jgi:hypothetical protein
MNTEKNKTVLLVNTKGRKLTQQQVDAINEHRAAGGLVAKRENCADDLPAFEYLQTAPD